MQRKKPFNSDTKIKMLEQRLHITDIPVNSTLDLTEIMIKNKIITLTSRPPLSMKTLNPTGILPAL